MSGRREATCECCLRNDAPKGESLCTSCSSHERGLVAGIYRAMKRGCLTWDEHDRAFIHKTDTHWETINSVGRLLEIGMEH